MDNIQLTHLKTYLSSVQKPSQDIIAKLDLAAQKDPHLREILVEVAEILEGTHRLSKKLKEVVVEEMKKLNETHSKREEPKKNTSSSYSFYQGVPPAGGTKKGRKIKVWYIYDKKGVYAMGTEEEIRQLTFTMGEHKRFKEEQNGKADYGWKEVLEKDFYNGTVNTGNIITYKLRD